MKSSNGFILLGVVGLCLCQSEARYVPVLIQRDPIGSWIQSSEWFPIEINVPDTISTIGQGISNVGQGISSGFMTLSGNFQDFIQKIPLFNRITSQFRPRPYFVLMPGNSGISAQFNPFDNAASGFIPTYP